MYAGLIHSVAFYVFSGGVMLLLSGTSAQNFIPGIAYGSDGAGHGGGICAYQPPSPPAPPPPTPPYRHATTDRD